jgi:eukaryotic-like serine/threonine-protein kinase
VTENLEEAHKTCEVWAQTYPRDAAPHDFLAGIIDPVLGKFEQAVEESEKAIQFDPDLAISYALLASNYQMLGRLQEAEYTLERASARKLQIPEFWLQRYDIAFLKDDGAGMGRIAALAREDAEATEWISNHAGSALAYSGHLQQARKMSRHAADLAQQAGHRESAALYEAGAAVWEAFFGNAPAARQREVEALRLSNDRGVEYGAALALALSGDSSRSQTLAVDLERRFPEDSQSGSVTCRRFALVSC